MSAARPPSALADLARLRSPATRALFASVDELYGDAIFGRDSLEAAEDIGHLLPDVARDVILTLARLQGTVDADAGTDSNEEERGKIHHEHRSLYVDGRRISARSQQLLEHLSELWGGDGTTMTYYGSADATPLFVRLVASHCRLHGPSLLDQGVVRKDGTATTVLDCTLAALDWITRRMDESPLGLRSSGDATPMAFPSRPGRTRPPRTCAATGRSRTGTPRSQPSRCRAMRTTR
jgi:glycogen debranching enzyme